MLQRMNPQQVDIFFQGFHTYASCKRAEELPFYNRAFSYRDVEVDNLYDNLLMFKKKLDEAV